MSEYQYYEFLAIDRPLDDSQRAAVRSLSTRAAITATTFVNEYHWGDFRGDPRTLVERYYDAHLYLAGWGTRQLMLRLPRAVLDIDVVADYCVGDLVSGWTVDEFVVLALTSQDDPDYDDHHESAGTLAGVVGVRGELAAGDLRPLYLAWLAGYGSWQRDEDAFTRDADDETEPPVPPGLGTLTAAQRALADFLRLDDDLLAIAAQQSRPLAETPDDPDRLAAWVMDLPPAEKNQFLLRVVQGDAVSVGMELRRRWRGTPETYIPHASRRTVADLLDGAARRQADHKRREAAQ